MPKHCLTCFQPYVTLIKETGTIYVHRKPQQDNHEVVPEVENGDVA